MTFMTIPKKTAYYSILSLTGLLISYLVFALQPVGGTDIPAREVLIDKGVGFTETANFLEREGLIRSARAFRWYGLLSGSAHLLKPGYYSLTPSEGAVKILETLVSGPQDVTVKIIEGSTLADIDVQLFAAGVTSSGVIKNFPIAGLRRDYQFLKNVRTLEGFLFPDTYKFAPHSDAESAIRKMLDTFSARVAPDFKISDSNFYKNLIIASLIEREVPEVADDRAIVSGIIARRLRIDMGLQIDATVLYAKCRGLLLSCASLKLVRSDFEINSPYNTYLYRGLPPTPIGNPGLRAIFAASHPQKTDYLFYLSDPKTGKTIFSKDFDEHMDKRAKYLGI